MSTDYGVYCIDCNDKYIIEDNHHIEFGRLLVRLAPKLAAFYPTLNELRDGAFGSDVFLRVPYENIDLSYFAKHEGHNLIACNEYGECDDECAEYFRCSSCGDRKTCRRLKKHDGDHSEKRDQ